MNDIEFFFLSVALVILGAIIFLAVETYNLNSCESNCVHIGNVTYYTFPFVLDGKECVAISRYSDGSGMVGINCD